MPRTKKKKKICKVYIFTNREKPYDRYVHLNVTGCCRSGSVLYVWEGDEEHRYDLNTIEKIHIREVKQGEIQ